MLWAGWVVGPRFRPTTWLPNTALLLCGLDPSQTAWSTGPGGSVKLSVASRSSVFFPGLEARVLATFWLDHPTAEGGAGGAEASEAEANAEREKPVATCRSVQATDAFPQTGSVHPLQPRRDEQQP